MHPLVYLPLSEDAKNTCPLSMKFFNSFGSLVIFSKIINNCILTPRIEQQQVAVMCENSTESGTIGWFIFGWSSFLSVVNLKA